MESSHVSNLDRLWSNDRERESRKEQRRFRRDSEGKKRQTKDLKKKWHRNMLSDEEEDLEKGLWFFDRENE